MNSRVVPSTSHEVSLISVDSNNSYSFRNRRWTLIKDILFATVQFVTMVMIIILCVYVIRDRKDRQQHANQHRHYDGITSPTVTNSTSKRAHEEICYSSDCISAAGRMLEAMDLSRDPCDDFYRFSCQKWIDDTVLVGKSQSMFSDHSTVVYWRTKELIENSSKESKIEHIVKSKTLFTSCMNKSNLEVVGIKPIQDDLEELGGLPVVVGPSWNNSTVAETFDIINMTHKLFRMGLDYTQFATFAIYRGIFNSSTIKLEMSEGHLAAGSRHTVLKGLSSLKIQNYYQLLQSLAVSLGADYQVAKQDMIEVLGMEIFIANETLSKEEAKNVTRSADRSITVKNLTSIAPQLEWLRLIRGFMPDDVTITEDFRLEVINLDYFVSLAKKLSEVDNRILANFMLIRAALHVTPHLNYNMRSLSAKYKKQVLGSSAPGDLVGCVSVVRTYLPFSVSNLYLKKHFSKQYKTDVSDVVESIRKVFRKSLTTVDWMDEATRREALDKIDGMHAFVGYDEEVLDDSTIDDHYRNVKMDESNFYRNVRNLLVFSRRNYFNYFWNPTHKTHWREHGKVYVSNAFYNPSENSIQITAAIADSYNPKLPRYSVYGGLGTIIGHEFTHGYDHNGAKFDLNGNKRDWWDEETSSKFQNKTKCMVKQYNRFTVEGIALNGEKTLGENIADNGGIKQSYLAYGKWKKEHGDDLQLPGLAYNSNQMFWISYATSRCAEYKQSYIAEWYDKYVHPPYPARVNVPLQNLPHFSEDFNCQSGTTMNPVQKCSVW